MPTREKKEGGRNRRDEGRKKKQLSGRSAGVSLSGKTNLQHQKNFTLVAWPRCESVSLENAGLIVVLISREDILPVRQLRIEPPDLLERGMQLARLVDVDLADILSMGLAEWLASA